MQIALQPPTFVTRWFGAIPLRRQRPDITRWYAAPVRQGRTREVEPPPGRVTVHCRDGEAWITHDGDPRDILLRPNESYTLDRRDRMRMHAVGGDCMLEIEVRR